jgi:hypothetical protein
MMEMENLKWTEWIRMPSPELAEVLKRLKRQEFIR